MPIPVRWEIARPLPARDALAQVLGVDPVVAQVLIARGYDSADRARAFLDAPLDSLPDPDGIVVDHHEPGQALPHAVAVVDPKRRDAGASFREYSAAGLAFQVLRAVRRRSHQPQMPEELLDLAALGTIADVVSLVEDNRIIARAGLQRMRDLPCLGLAALIKVAGVSGDITARHVGFSLAPRLNAAGRLGDAGVAVKLLTTGDPAEADAIAAQLDAANQQRRALCDQILAQAIEQVESSPP